MTFCSLKTWGWITGAIALTVLLFLWFDPPYAGGLFWSFFSGESSVAFWGRKMNLPFWASFSIATACGSFDIFTFFCLFPEIKKFYETSERRTVYRFCYNIYTLLVPRPAEFAGGKKTIGWTAQRYVPLLAYGFVPTCTWTGVVYSFSFRLNLFAALLVLIVVNAAKTAVFGYFAVKIPFWSVLPMLVIGPMIIRYIIDRFRKHGD